jgi:hypothetical protein
MAQESNTIPMIAALMGVALFGYMGVAVLVSGVKNVWWGAVSSGWARAPAEVIRSEVTTERSRNSDRTTSTTYTAHLLFAYEVAGEQYTTGQIRFGESLGSGDPSEPELHRLRYPEGARVSVVYDPKDPSVAAARPGLHLGALLPPVAGLALILCAVLIFLGARMAMAGAPVLPHLLRVFVSVFLLMGLSMLVAGLLNLYRAGKSEGWPAVTGTIVYQQGDNVENRWRDSEGRTQTDTTYSTSIVYSYPVDGVTHFANTRHFGQLAGAGREWAAGIASRYPVGSEVEVRYNPVDPDIAVLEPGFHPDVWWIPGIGLAFSLFGLAVWIWAIPALTQGW